MNMVEAVKSVLSQYVGFRGRARRSEYWYWVLATSLISIALAFIESLIGISDEGSGPLSTIFGLAIFIPGLAVLIRRLHDTGRSGWWLGGFYLALLVFVILTGIAAFSVGNSEGGLMGLGVFAVVAVVVLLIYAVALLVFLCTDSQPGPNKYGDNPKGEGNYDVFG